MKSNLSEHEDSLLKNKLQKRYEDEIKNRQILLINCKHPNYNKFLQSIPMIKLNPQKTVEDIQTVLVDIQLNEIVFESSTDDTLYHLYRHLRNSYAHSGISKHSVNNIEYYELCDYYRKDSIEYPTMYGKIECKLLERLVDAIYNSGQDKETPLYPEISETGKIIL